MSGWSSLQKQPVAARLLQNQVQLNRISHAYLFYGPTGSGKTAAAKTLAQAVNCSSRENPCGQCWSCRQIEKATYPDLRIITAQGSSIKLAQIKAMLEEAVLTPNSGPKRVFIIEEASLMTREAANALLMMLEEPPSFDVFVLTASSAVLPTIESRCQVVNFVRQASPAVGHELSAEEQVGADVKVDKQHDLCRRVKEFVLGLVQTPLANRTKYVEQLEGLEEELADFLSILLKLYRDLFWLQNARECPELVVENLAREVEQTGYLTEKDMASCCDALLMAERQLTQNVNRKMLLEQLCHRL